MLLALRSEMKLQGNAVTIWSFRGGDKQQKKATSTSGAADRAGRGSDTSYEVKERHGCLLWLRFAEFLACTLSFMCGSNIFLISPVGATVGSAELQRKLNLTLETMEMLFSACQEHRQSVSSVCERSKG
ncbi:hypothetical protein Ancab_023576 [Ancistrocladus abbreviatus]